MSDVPGEQPYELERAQDELEGWVEALRAIGTCEPALCWVRAVMAYLVLVEPVGVIAAISGAARPRSEPVDLDGRAVVYLEMRRIPVAWWTQRWRLGWWPTDGWHGSACGCYESRCATLHQHEPDGTCPCLPDMVARIRFQVLVAGARVRVHGRGGTVVDEGWGLIGWPLTVRYDDGQSEQVAREVVEPDPWPPALS